MDTPQDGSARPALSSAKKALLEKRLRGAAASAPRETIPPRTGTGPLPLSFPQQRLWFLEQLEPGRPFYHIGVPVRMRGRLDRGALARALSEIVRRHEALRTGFVLVDGEPRQTVRPPFEVEIPLDECAGIPHDALLERIRAELEAPFDLERDPLVRARLLRLGDEEHVLAATLHHVISDGWSMGVFIRELTVLYEAFVEGRPSPLPDLPLQYGDFAVWQRGRLGGEVLEKQLAYWREQLRGLPTIELPTDFPRPPVQSHRGAGLWFRLPVETSARLRALATAEGATLFMLLLAAWQTLLLRYTGQDDLVVGTPIANRTRKEIEPLIGFFVNTLVLRGDLSGDPPFRELLRRVRETTLGAYAHQDLPFERLVEELQPERDLSRNPLFQVLFALQNAPEEHLELAGLKLTWQWVDSTTAKFDLMLWTHEERGEIVLLLEYATDLFRASTVERMRDHLVTLLDGILAAPDAPLSALPLLAPAERRRILGEWNDTARELPPATLHGLFEAQAARAPERVALEFAGGRWSYAELDRRASALAAALAARGVGPETRVALCLERGPEMVAALLAVLRAGGAYVPLDPAYPADRIAYVLSDSGARVLLTQERLVEAMPSFGGEVMCIEDVDDVAVAGCPLFPVALHAARAPVEPCSLSLAYAIYTSGSTGRPKGVMVTHGAAVNFLHAMRERPGISPDDALLAVTTLAFDIALLELLLPLSVGARVVLADRETAADPVALADLLAASGATVMQATPATWKMLVFAGWEGDRSLRVLSGGEALPGAIADLLRERSAAVWNLYGPTETTVWSTLHPVTGSEPVVPIGAPIANTRAYVLDAAFQPVPAGVPGGLYLAGAGVARGYLGRPELTAERFLPEPFGGEPGARMYRTGDRARWREDGVLEFLGRDDHQVKVRGFRIEPGEVESALAAHPGVREAAVAALDDGTGEARLVAYVVEEERVPEDAPELRAWLRDRLPDYMVPSLFVALDALPRTANGKTDRAALPAPEGGRAGVEAEYVEPRTAVEEALAAIWAETLHVDRVGVHDNFFELGGHSILATQAVVATRSTLQAEVPVRVLFEHPTVAELAAAIVARDPVPGQTERVAEILRLLGSMSDDEAAQTLLEQQALGGG
ncbi:MAG TPA: amino acid adenylation domain-containing protein [Longimicrobiaceae bacterium]|jgi:amino acid adenylation domain-containing protein